MNSELWSSLISALATVLSAFIAVYVPELMRRKQARSSKAKREAIHSPYVKGD